MRKVIKIPNHLAYSHFYSPHHQHRVVDVVDEYAVRLGEQVHAFADDEEADVDHADEADERAPVGHGEVVVFCFGAFFVYGRFRFLATLVDGVRVGIGDEHVAVIASAVSKACLEASDSS